jgi:hypothetical protein
MDANRERLLDELLAKQEIHDVMMRYCRGVNRLDPDLVRSCFHPDAYEDHGAFKGSAVDFSAAFTPERFTAFKSMFHLVGNQLVELDGDRAAHEAYFVGSHRYDDDSGQEMDVFFGGRYLSVFERRDRGPWLIARRMVVHDWSRMDPVTPWAPAAQFEPGKFSRADPVFRLLEGA